MSKRRIKKLQKELTKGLKKIRKQRIAQGDRPYIRDGDHIVSGSYNPPSDDEESNEIPEL